MRHKFCLLLFFVAALSVVLQSCDDDDSYAERRKRERNQVSAFLSKGLNIIDKESGDTLVSVSPNINVISEAQFYAQDSTTDVSKNEYVLFSGSGVYMQILRKGSGEILGEGKSATIINRYYEYNLATDSLQSTNISILYETLPDMMTCQNNYGVFTASFTSGLMSSLYNTKSVPSGWLIPLKFIRLGRQDSEQEEIAKVRLIVPSTEGQTDAYDNTYPCFYEISYQRGR